MRTLTGYTLFSGGGLVEAALPCVQWIGAVEFDPKIAAHHQVAHPSVPVIVDDVSNVDYRPWAGVDIGHFSPSCQQASNANQNKGETAEDRASGEAVSRALRETRPHLVTLENVAGYASFDAFRGICQTLTELGYRWSYAVYNSADFGTAQTRKRLYLRAWNKKHGPLPDVSETHASTEAIGKAGAVSSLFDAAPETWRGWYPCIEDLVPTLQPDELAKWQMERLPEGIFDHLLCHGTDTRHEGETFARRSGRPAPTVVASVYKGVPRAVLIDGQSTIPAASGMREDRALATRNAEGRAFCVAASVHKGMPRAILVDGTSQPHRPPTRSVGGKPCMSLNSGGGGRFHRVILIGDQLHHGEGVSLRHDAEPAQTIAANPSHKHRALLDAGRVVRLSTRALARFQDVPDAYPLPANERLACTIIGNGVAGNLQRAITGPMMEVMA